ncbi:hypothetical protein N7491_010671 [Penicillium cf. griseofulvum]|uniref:Uncharacterized protein n=1 Tax=Penicillium cf. griseofulvum TaxID=2972120 RepID=A0A9W9T627_9EURO|nr:hypothetical protein N7472_000998 [Penicillium cf. griseofulvum]KAJ5422226.1 hypothetical protein N7491_010671 [Penicillium cf. griseofulvum]
MTTLADQRQIPVLNDSQLELLTQLRLRATRRAQARRALLQEVSRTLELARRHLQDSNGVALRNCEQIMAQLAEQMLVLQHQHQTDRAFESHLWSQSG